MTAVSEDVVLDVDLDERVPCDVPACNAPAVWRLFALHRTDDRACVVGKVCDHHRETTERELDAFARRHLFTITVCSRHLGAPAVGEWRPL